MVWGGVYPCGDAAVVPLFNEGFQHPAHPACTAGENQVFHAAISLSYNSPRLRSTRERRSRSLRGGIHQWKPAGSRLVASELHSGLHWDGVHLREASAWMRGRKSSWSWRLPIKSPSKTVGRAGAPPGIRVGETGNNPFAPGTGWAPPGRRCRSRGMRSSPQR